MTIPNPDAMNTLPFLASITATVGVPATNWDAPGIILLKLFSSRFPRPAKRLFRRKRVRYRQGAREPTRGATRPEQRAHPVSPARYHALGRLSRSHPTRHHLG